MTYGYDTNSDSHELRHTASKASQTYLDFDADIHFVCCHQNIEMKTRRGGSRRYFVELSSVYLCLAAGGRLQQ